VEDALEQTLTRVTTGPGDVTVAVDVSGSMSSTVSPRSRVRCVDVGALFGAALTRSNPDARLLTFNTVARPLACDGPLRQTTHAIRDRLGGGTACAAPLEWLLHRDQRPDLVVLISDSESWYDTSVSRQTRATAAWRVLLRRNPDAKLVSLDLQPYRTSQVPEHESILHIGGFSDRLFDVIRRFREHALGPGHWVREIERTQLPTSPALLPALRDGMAS
jgi:60 kDa SS-A/Ro ribonucleoprotein